MSAKALSAQVGPDTSVTLSYTVFDADGDEVDRSPPEQPVIGLFGYGQLLPAVEQAIEGLTRGQMKSIELSPSEAFGPRDPRALIEVDRSDFPDDVAPGDHFEMENEEGRVLVLKVLDVADDCVVLDTNHPLAGQRVRIELTVQDVRPATSQELDAAQARLEQAPDQMPEPLIGVDRLLRRGTQS